MNMMAPISDHTFHRSELQSAFRTAPLPAVEDHLRACVLAMSYVHHPQLTVRQRFRFAASMPFEIVDDVGAGDGSWPDHIIDHILAPDDVSPLVEMGRSHLPPSLWLAPNDAVLAHVRAMLLAQTFETWPVQKFPDFIFPRRVAFANAAPIEIIHDPEAMPFRARDDAKLTLRERAEKLAFNFQHLKDVFRNGRKQQRRSEAAHARRH